MPYYIKSKTVHHETGEPAIAIHSSTTPGGLPLRYIVFPDQETLDKEFDGFDPDVEYERYGLIPPPVETFLDFGDCGFDARDVLTVNIWRMPPSLSPDALTWYVVVSFRTASPRDKFNIPVDSEQDAQRKYARVVAAMKASR